MNPASLHDMKHSIVRAVQDYVDIEAEELIEVRRTASLLFTAFLDLVLHTGALVWAGISCHVLVDALDLSVHVPCNVPVP